LALVWYDQNGQYMKAFVPLPGGETAVYNSSGLAYYTHADWLGTTRLASTPARALAYDGEFGPFGEPWANEIAYGGTAQSYRSFTGQNQDTNPGVYDFMYREYSPYQSRWINPDPAGLAAVSLANPQSWNRYAYVVNIPLVGVDRFGLFGPAGDCDPTSCNYFDYQMSASNQNVDLSFDSWVDYNDRQTFGNNYYDLPGHGNVTEQDQNGWYASQVSQAFHPTGDGWGPIGPANPDYFYAGCWSNSNTDLNWCPNAGAFMSNVIVVWNGRAPFMPHIYAIHGGSTAVMRAPTPPMAQPRAAGPGPGQVLFCLFGGDPELAGTTSGPGFPESPWNNHNGDGMNPAGAANGDAAAGAAIYLGGAADCLGRSPY
jgi:RHS repeat-associated protein